MTRNAVECVGLQKTYPAKKPVHAVRGIDLEVREGECFGLLGPNGAGKTTTIEILEGLLAPSAGDVRLWGVPWRGNERALRERIGISLQETRLSDRLTVRETLHLFRSFFEDGLTADQAIARVSLEEKADTWVMRLSGGQRQRLAVASALVGDPDLLFLDEPTTGLDPQSRRQLWSVVEGFVSEGRTVMLTTHYMEEAERLCHRVAIVDAGRVIAIGTPRELIASLGGDHVIEFTFGDDRPIDEVALKDLASVRQVRMNGGASPHVALAVGELHTALPALLDYAKGVGRAVSHLTTRHATLEDVFIALTGRALRDQGGQS